MHGYASAPLNDKFSPFEVLSRRSGGAFGLSDDGESSKLQEHISGRLYLQEKESHIINETVEKMVEICGLLYGDEKGYFHLGTVVELPLYPVL